MNGFDMRLDPSKPPGRRINVTSLPTCQGLIFTERDIHDLLHTLEETSVSQVTPSTQDVSASSKRGLLDLDGHRVLWSATAIPRPKKVWSLLACRACRGAIMIGKALRKSEMEKILVNLSTLKQPWNCPHGRPTMRHLVDAGAAKSDQKKVNKPLAEVLADGGGAPQK
eukprot:TRINITY_DN35752_c0_g1_i2.p1 TRINITY_DN35752_c0_g1~~TRINITY_DN35752_c0_g1_i2.p1  ORF type:complete len:168 (+),score=30.47 TRINITY_DN35752_c0_g1_i2:254-757(+)